MIKTIVFLVFPPFKLLDLAGPLQVFEDARRHLHPLQDYDIHVVSPFPGPQSTDTLLKIPLAPLSSLKGDINTLLFVGGQGARAAAKNPDLIDKSRSLIDKAQRVGSICTGAFMLAATGSLSNKRAVTHWDHCDELRIDFPDVKVETDPIYIREETIWSSAGVTAGIDLALAMVKEDFDRQVSLNVARSLVTYMVRPGGQSQFSQPLEDQCKDVEGQFEDLLHYIHTNLHGDLSVQELAAKAVMSPRSFSRHFTRVFKTPPAKYVAQARLTQARKLLEESELPIKSIAADCGYLDDERMRKSFHRQLKISPQCYRDHFKDVEKWRTGEDSNSRPLDS